MCLSVSAKAQCNTRKASKLGSHPSEKEARIRRPSASLSVISLLTVRAIRLSADQCVVFEPNRGPRARQYTKHARLHPCFTRVSTAACKDPLLVQPVKRSKSSLPSEEANQRPDELRCTPKDLEHASAQRHCWNCEDPVLNVADGTKADRLVPCGHGIPTVAVRTSKHTLVKHARRRPDGS